MNPPLRTSLRLQAQETHGDVRLKNHAVLDDAGALRVELLDALVVSVFPARSGLSLAVGAAAVIDGKKLRADEHDLEGAQELYGLMLGVIGERRRVMRTEGLLVPVEVSIVMSGDNALTTRDSYPSRMSELAILNRFSELVHGWVAKRQKKTSPCASRRLEKSMSDSEAGIYTVILVRPGR